MQYSGQYTSYPRNDLSANRLVRELVCPRNVLSANRCVRELSCPRKSLVTFRLTPISMTKSPWKTRNAPPYDRCEKRMYPHYQRPSPRVSAIASDLDRPSTWSLQQSLSENKCGLFGLWWSPGDLTKHDIADDLESPFNVVSGTITRSSAVAERPRKASYRWIFCSVTQGNSRLFERIPLSRACVSPVLHWNSVSRTVSEIFSVKEWRDIETGGRGRSMSLKMAPFDRSYIRHSIGRPL